MVRETGGRSAVISTLKDYSHQKNNVWGIVARNREQNFALNLLTNPDVDFVSLLGQAGTGKTLLALAAGGETPVEHALRVMRDPAVDPETRLHAAKVAAPFCDPVVQP